MTGLAAQIGLQLQTTKQRHIARVREMILTLTYNFEVARGSRCFLCVCPILWQSVNEN